MFLSRYIDINAISLCLDLNIFQQDQCFCSKLGMEVDYAKTWLFSDLGDLSLASFCQSRAVWLLEIQLSWSSNLLLNIIFTFYDELLKSRLELHQNCSKLYSFHHTKYIPLRRAPGALQVYSPWNWVGFFLFVFFSSRTVYQYSYYIKNA